MFSTSSTVFRGTRKSPSSSLSIFEGVEDVTVRCDREVPAELEEDGVHRLTRFVGGRSDEHRFEGPEPSPRDRLSSRKERRDIGELVPIMAGEDRAVDREPE